MGQEIQNKSEKYPNINNNMVNFHHVYNTTLKYTYYDINKDGEKELIINTSGESSEFEIAEIYTYNGTKAIRFIEKDCLGERCSAEIYDNGIIYFYGASSARSHGVDFYKIASDGYTKETISTYGVEYDENGKLTILDSNNNKTEFKTEDELINSVKKDANTIDLSTLNWKEITK